MYQKIIHNRTLLTSICILLLMAEAGCIKSSDSMIGRSDSMKFEGGDLKKAMAGIDTLSLFRQALDRIGFTAKLESNNAYTIFAPGNEAMKAAGLDAAGMTNISLDSLRKIITYHILPGAIDKTALESLPVTRYLQTLRSDTISVPFQGFKIRDSWLAVQNGHQLFVNGFAFNNPPPVAAANGFIYPIGVFINGNNVDDSRTVWEVVESDLDLSMFREAIELLDSIKLSESFLEQELFWMQMSPPPDIDELRLRKSDPAGNTFVRRAMPFVLAPVNQAFYDAGFHTIDDLRAFALRYPFGVKAIYNEEFTELEFKFRFSSLDTLLAMNMMWHAGMTDGELRYPSRVLYGDFLTGRINNGVFNCMFRKVGEGFGRYSVGPFTLQFSNENGIGYVQYLPGSGKVMILKDTDPRHPINNFNVDNGMLYKVNKLFYPFN